jgi:hypothetical protein
MKWRRSIAIFFMAGFLLAPGRATAQDMVVGVNVVNPMRASVADQNVPDSQEGSVELEECVSQWPGHPDHILIQKGVCETQGYRRLRSAGFVFSAAQPHTQSRCTAAIPTARNPTSPRTAMIVTAWASGRLCLVTT